MPMHMQMQMQMLQMQQMQQMQQHMQQAGPSGARHPPQQQADLTQVLQDLTQVLQENGQQQPRAAGGGTPLAKRPVDAPKTDCALKAAMPGRVHLQVNPKLVRKDAAIADQQTATYGLQFAVVGHLSLNHERTADAGKAAEVHRVCVACLNADKNGTMRFDKDFPCVMCYRCGVLKRGKSGFCRQCREGLERHEKDEDNKKRFFFEQVMQPVLLTNPGWEAECMWEWRTIGGFVDRRNEKRCDAVMVFRNVLGSQHVLVAVEFVLSSDITDLSLRDKRVALQRYATENTGCKIVFILAYQNHHPDGDDRMTLLTLGASPAQRARMVICDGKHLPALCRPEASTHQWKQCVHWNENKHLNAAFDKRPAGSPNTLMEQSDGLFGHAGLIQTAPE